MARAVIMPLPGGTITGTVLFLEVPGGVQVAYAIENCAPGSHQTHIHEGTGCGSTAQQGMHWGPQRGENIGPTGAIVCDAAMRGTLTYTRPSTNPTTRWTIGDGSESDILGHPVIIHGLNVNDRQGCGVIER